MRIVGARWTPVVNMLFIVCGIDGCKKIFAHRADRWWALCPVCHQRENLAVLRERYCNEV